MRVARRFQQIDELTTSDMWNHERVSGSMKGMRVIMTSILRTPYGEMQQFLERLHTAGGTYEDVKQVNKRPDLASGMVAALRSKPGPTWSLPDWYVAPWLRRQWALQANIDRQWGFEESDFPAVPDDTTKFWLLEINLPPKGRKAGFRCTIDEFFELIDLPRGYTKEHANGFATDSDRLQILPDYKYRRGIRWVELDLNAYRGMSATEATAQSVLDGVELLGVGAFAGVWQFPEWISSWKGLGLAGLVSRGNDGMGHWSTVPYLCRWSGTRTFGLMPKPDHLRFTDNVWPTIKECTN